MTDKQRKALEALRQDIDAALNGEMEIMKPGATCGEFRVDGEGDLFAPEELIGSSIIFQNTARSNAFIREAVPFWLRGQGREDEARFFECWVFAARLGLL